VILRLVERRARPAALGPAWDPEGFRSGAPARLVHALGRPGWGCDVVLVDDQAMAGLNREYRDLPDVTDVLSFSYLQDAGGGEPALKRGEGRACRDLWLDPVACEREGGQPPVVGEVVLAPGFITERCRAKGWPEYGEVPLLLVHGVLHILGWDHQTDREAAAMRKVEAEILAGEGLPHPLLERS
jgi:probable rRNA maturation factor